MAVTINEGTQTDILTTTIGGTETGIVRLDVGVGTTRADFGGTITTVDALTNGTVRVSVGTITQGTLTNLVSGTINALAAGTITGGTLQNIVGGTLGQVTLVPTVTTVSNLTNGTARISVGTVGGAVASGAAASGNPNIIGGTDSGGTVYTVLVDTAGNPQVDIVTIPQVSVGTLPTLNLTTGTITTGSLANIAQVHNAGTLAAGANNIGDVDIATGTVTQVTTVSNLTNGSINILTGTVTALTTVSNLTNGSINILTGTIQNSGTTTGVGVVSNLTNGSVNVLTGTVTSVTNLAGGTVRIDPTSVATPLTFGTLGTAGGSLFGTLSAASGAGTRHYVSGLQVVGQAGTVDVRILNGTAIQGAGVLAGGICVPGGGFARDFNKDFQTGTNSELTYHFVGAGTAFITVNYWKGA